MEDAKKIVGRRIKNLREARGLNQIDFSIALGVSDKTISSWEIGRTEPNIAMMNKIAEFFNVTLDQLMGWEEDDNISNRDGIIENVDTVLSDAGYSLSCESYDDASFPIKDKAGNTIQVLRDGYLISLYNNAVKNNTLSYKTFTEATPDSVTVVSMDKIVFDDYFPLHYCTNLSAGSFDEILEAEPDAVVYVPIKFQGRRRKLLAFQVNGTSMNNVIEDHSIVVVENTSTDGINYKDGTIIVAYCDGMVTVKRIYKQPDGNISLVPDSTDKTHLPIMINPEEHPITIIGKVLWHMNPDDIAEKKY